MLKRKLTLFLMLSACLTIMACGQSGPLYHPDQPPPIYVPRD